VNLSSCKQISSRGISILAMAAMCVCRLGGALIPPSYLDCIVAIGRDTPVMVNGVQIKENNVVKTQWEPVASGFLYGRPTGIKNDKGMLYNVFLVTNRHVFQGASVLSLRFNPKEAKPAKEYSIPLIGADGKQLWYAPADSQLDVAVLGVNMDVLKNDGIQADFFPADTNAADIAKAKEIGVSEGDGVFVLGFPLSLVGGERNFVIVRQGSIARIGDLLAGFSKSFLVDTFIFPGNSGGPVVLRPELTSITGTKSQNNALLIGLVSSFQTYQDTAVSQQTGRPRVVFEENAGLANVLPVDQINMAIEEALKVNKTK
jgi:hypothetical protein